MNSKGYEILLDLLHIKKFSGDDNTKDPYSHIDFFEDVCGIFKLISFTHEEMKLRIFNEQTLTRKACIKICPQE
jgi:hypothetical protein